MSCSQRRLYKVHDRLSMEGWKNVCEAWEKSMNSHMHWGGNVNSAKRLTECF